MQKVGNSVDSKTLWIGDLQTWMDEAYISSLATSLGFFGDLASLKIIKDKVTGLPAKYGFLQFKTHELASKMFNLYNGKQIPGTNKSFRMNWAAYGGGIKPSNVLSNKNSPQQMSIYVGDIEASVTQQKLLQFFKSKYPSAFIAKIITDNTTKLPKGYGFVKFSNHEQAHKAISETNGVKLQGKPMKVSNAYLKTKEDFNQAEGSETQISQRLKLYQQYYSMINDPQLKIQYEKQMQKTFGIEGPNKNTVRENLQKLHTLTYFQTEKSLVFLNSIPRKVSFQARQSIQSQIFS